MAFCISYYFWVLLMPRDGQSNCLGTCSTPEHRLCRSIPTANLSPVFQCVPECPQTVAISEQKWGWNAVRSPDMINDIRKHHPSLPKGVQWISSSSGLVVFQPSWKGKQPDLGCWVSWITNSRHAAGQLCELAAFLLYSVTCYLFSCSSSHTELSKG